LKQILHHLQQRLSTPAAWAAIIGSVMVLGVIDWTTGYELNFFVFYFLPVSYAGWRFGQLPAVNVSLGCGAVWAFADQLSGNSYSHPFYAVWNTLIRLSAFLFIGWVMARNRSILEEERELAGQLRHSLSEVKILEGLLPVCCECKKIRDEKNQWQPMEEYVSGRTSVVFTHGYCPECARRALQEAGMSADQLPKA
jgi:hypothetical protein